MAPLENPQKLVREVLPPQQPNHGLGVMMVAATAMFFAVASSAFILRARMSECCTAPDMRAPTMLIDISSSPETAVEIPVSEQDCGQAKYHLNPDGSYSIYFEVCPPPAGTMVIGDPGEDDDSTTEPPIEGVEVGRIIYER